MTVTSLPVLLNPAATDAVLARIRFERARQDARWGVQRHPDGTNLPGSGTTAHIAKRLTDDAMAKGTVTWALIAHEEVAEAAAEADEVRLLEEVIQTAAVYTQWAEHLIERISGVPR